VILRQLPRLLLLLLCSACASAPRLRPLEGTAYDGPIPATPLTGYRLVTFRWEYRDLLASRRGEGTARIAAPDSVRLDLHLSGGYGSTHVVLIGDGPIQAPPDEEMARMYPGSSLVWAAIGRLALGAVPDTTKRLAAGIIVAQFGTDTIWRASFDEGRLVQLLKATGGKVVERVTRSTDGSVTYVRGSGTLRMTDVRERNAEPFDKDIWR
jgi:hypothetical protein